MTKCFTFVATVALAGTCLLARAQDGGKMLKKEGRTDNKMLRENRSMMKDGKVKSGEKMGSEPKAIKKEDRMDHKKGHKHKAK